ncbi:MAG: aminopeptidase P family protein [Zestosphaera sp.]
MRLGKLMRVVEEFGLDAVLVTYEWNVFYYLGVPRSGGVFLLYERDGSARVLTPALDYHRVSDAVKGSLEVMPYATYELPGFPKLLKGRLSDWLVRYFSDSGFARIGLDLSYPTQLAFELSERLRDRIKVENVGSAIALQRSIKEGDEVEFMRQALNIAERSFVKLLAEGIEGLSESQVAAKLDSFMRLEGAESIPFETIVASGPNSAYPHAFPTGRTIGKEAVTIDFGARYGGYCSDTTRTLAMGGSSPEVMKVVEGVSEALTAASDLISDGVKASEPDSVAREVLRKHGLEQYFIHSLGHGVGLEVHERPRLAQGVDDVLMEGMIITVEPGTYMPGSFGVRLENMVLVKKRGCEFLNRLPIIIA